jgi:hydroxyacylglutathione hydrolase
MSILSTARDGPIAFDAGIKDSGPAILDAAGSRLDRVILSHIDHRGGAGELCAPIYCHPDEVADAEGDAGRHYTDFSLIKNERFRELPAASRSLGRRACGDRGDDLGRSRSRGSASFTLPGHAPGQIALSASQIAC